VERSRSSNSREKYYRFNDSKKLIAKIDTLQSLYPVKSAQVRRLNALKKLLQDRDRLYVNYLEVREGLIDNRSFSAKVKNLNEIVAQSAQQADSMVTTTEKKTSTTTVYPAYINDKRDNRSFFNKLFGKRKTKDTDSLSKPFQIVNEELNVKHDTLAKAIQDSLLKGLGRTMRDLEKVQQQKSSLFVNREAVLIKSSENIIGQILSILNKVEAEVVIQTAGNNEAAKSMVRSSIKRISLIMVAFAVLIVLLVYLILTDISRLNKYREELENARDEAEYYALAKQRFLSNMSHEIRTPLQSIIGYAEMLKQQAHPQQRDVDAIYNSSSHLMQIVNEVLDYNQIISGKISFVNQPFNMQALLDETVTIMRLQADKKGIALTAHVDEAASVFVNGDPFRLKQILFNLLGNAIKFTERGEVALTVRCSSLGSDFSFQFDITDTGIGLSADDATRIFNEFEQAGDEKLMRAGTGLGLPITKELVESQGGQITVKSKLGEGSSFSFNLTFEKANQTSVPAVKNSKGVIDGNSKVWIIDDDPFILELCSRIFDNHSIPYRCFNSPHDLLAAEWDAEVKYILLDIRMPEMSGTELCRLIRRQVPAHVLIYALTAQALPDERESVLAHGFNGLLMKPFRENELVALVTANKPAGDEVPLLNIAAIEKMTFGDPEQTAKILAQFAKDSFNDIKQLKAAITGNDTLTLSLVTHRIAGRTAQAGARKLAEGFRQVEIELGRGKELTPADTVSILALCEELHTLAITAEEYGLKETLV
jgi:signal transduction histidine kinase/DNA-binding NarL/FixJ family response regulator